VCSSDLFRGVPLFSADRGHIHHRLLDRGLTHRQAVLVIYGGGLVCGISALLVSFANGFQTAVILLVVSALAYVALRALGYADLAKAGAALEERRQNLDLHAAVRRAEAALRGASSLEQVWAVVRDQSAAFGAAGVGLKVGAGQAWRYGFDDLPDHALQASFGLAPEHPGQDVLELAWDDGRKTVDRDMEIAVELFCAHTLRAVERVAKGMEG
jgi:UDP-GlcNAc:undecaprenyl-phosphate GlcNAc-1-phosphate transferase